MNAVLEYEWTANVPACRHAIKLQGEESNEKSSVTISLKNWELRLYAWTISSRDAAVNSMRCGFYDWGTSCRIQCFAVCVAGVRIAREKRQIVLQFALVGQSIAVSYNASRPVFEVAWNESGFVCTSMLQPAVNKLSEIRRRSAMIKSKWIQCETTKSSSSPI